MVVYGKFTVINPEPEFSINILSADGDAAFGVLSDNQGYADFTTFDNVEDAREYASYIN